MADIASPLNPLFDGPVAMADQIGLADGKTVDEGLANLEQVAVEERASRLASVTPAVADDSVYRFTTPLGWEIAQLSERGLVMANLALTEAGLGMPGWSIGARDGTGAFRLASAIGWEIMTIGTDGSIDTGLFSIGPAKVTTPVVGFQQILGLDGVVFTSDLGWIIDVAGTAQTGTTVDLATTAKVARPANTVVWFWHSKGDQNSYAGHTNGGVVRRSDLGSSVWADYFLRGSTEPIYNASIGGQNSADLLSRVAADVIAKAPAWCFFGVPTCNDVNAGRPAAACIQNDGNIVAQMRAAGIRVLIHTDPTWATGHSDLTAAGVTTMNSVNRWVLRLPLTEGGIVAADTAAAVVDPLAAAGAAKAGYLQTDDNIHPAPRAARAMGKVKADALRAHGFPVLDLLPRSVADAYSLSTASRQLLDDPLFLATGGTNGAGATLTGAIPAGWSVSKSGTWGNGMASSALVPRADGLGNDWVLTVTGTGAADDYLTLSGPDISSRVAAGDQLEVVADVALTGMAKVNEHSLYMLVSNGITPGRVSMFERDDTALWGSDMYDQSDLTGGVFRTGTIAAPVGGTLAGISPRFRFRWDGAGGTAVIRIGRIGVIKR